ncbi:zinc finger, CCHC-type containing protein [Tanacetum coccineum]|uniref:Zinc finger, CCHC-type containing protein n=1 Tax=Tanacetum coccineum TaxID=301880 RepID=A0ABQ5BXP1_9ASTR
MPVRRIEFPEYAVLFGEQIRRLDCKTQYAVLSRRCDTSYPTGGYGVPGGIRRIGNWSNPFSCEVRRLYAVSLLLDTAYKKITRKEDIGGNFKILCNIGGLKHMNALVDQGSDVNVMPLSTYMKLIDERPAETDIRLYLASHSYIYPLGIAEDVLVEVVEHVYPVDFVILDIKENEKRPFILGTSFLTTAKVDEKEIKNNIEPIAPTMTVNRLVLEWEKKIKLHQEKEMEFDRWRNKNFKNGRPTPVKIKDGMVMKEKSRKNV